MATFDNLRDNLKAVDVETGGNQLSGGTNANLRRGHGTLYGRGQRSGQPNAVASRIAEPFVVPEQV